VTFFGGVPGRKFWSPLRHGKLYALNARVSSATARQRVQQPPAQFISQRELVAAWELLYMVEIPQYQIVVSLDDGQIITILHRSKKARGQAPFASPGKPQSRKR